MPVIRKFLDLSTIHLKREDVEVLNAAARSFAGLSCSKTEHGWFVWSPEEIDAYSADQVPDNLRRLLAYAREHGCDYVLIDADAEVNRDLPTHPADWNMAADEVAA